jgi:GAF domain-containing protein
VVPEDINLGRPEYTDVNVLPLNVIRYVGRMKELLVINNSARQAEYCELPYFLAHQPLSVLIYPILKQGELEPGGINNDDRQLFQGL